jgi:hypothetical protein
MPYNMYEEIHPWQNDEGRVIVVFELLPLEYIVN